MSLIIDIESLAKPAEVILANLPPWDEDEARTRLPKNYKVPATIGSWLEEDRSNHGKDILDRAALMPEYANVAVVGVYNEVGVGQASLKDHAEEVLVGAALEHIEMAARKGRFVLGWNILGFDLPFLIRRAWILGVKVGTMIYNPLSRYPVSENIVDMMDRFKCGNRKAPHTSLNNALKSMGLPEKPDGKEFAKMWAESQTKALAYNREEILGQADLYRRMGVEL